MDVRAVTETGREREREGMKNKERERERATKAALTGAECKPVSTESPPISGAVSLNLSALWFSIFIFFLIF